MYFVLFLNNIVWLQLHYVFIFFIFPVIIKMIIAYYDVNYDPPQTRHSGRTNL
jgi:hypothetical protein